jgi:hypothetical protein
MPRTRRKTLSRPDKQRAAELKAILRLQRVTTSLGRKRMLAEWAQELQRPSRVAWGKIAHPALWMLAFDLWTDAHTADVQLLLQAAPLVGAGGCDDTTARRYIKQAQKIVPKRPRAIRPASPVAPTLGLLQLGELKAPPPDADT